jgi:AcrR family transcriptional regulator
VATAIELLDRGGEAALTFKTLATQLETGAGAIYGHIRNKDDLMIAASDAVIAKVASQHVGQTDPQDSIRAFALGMFDAFDAHPWVGAALTHMPGQTPLVRMLDVVGQAIRALGVSPSREWPSAMAVFNYIVGVGGQNAANAQVARAENLNRTEVLAALASTWSNLDPAEYPFAHSIGPQLRTHDDRADFLAGVDFILAGITASSGQPGAGSPQ